MITPEKTKPTALVVGPMKCGTSWIHEYFESRGDICLPSGVKETFYFDRYHHRGLAWYEKHFRHCDPDQNVAIIEVGPSLFHVSSFAAPKIAEELGDIPIVVTLRDPVKRAWSHYQHMACGYTKLPLQKAVKKYPEIIGASRYSEHLPIWKAHFSKVTVLLQSDLADDPDGYVETLSNALGIPLKGAGDLAAQRRNEATTPRSFLLARLGRYGARSLRFLGLYSVVSALKDAGLKSIFYGGGKATKLVATDNDMNFLEDLLESERQFVSPSMAQTGLS
ncbi:sulfotransferase domain-containing protein [Ruegeria arenilitoris]|uniref:sulfotransferase domain-containing protein n=1 Tax=Ruegeria arenilitoris TaxID=1173585 RepID=UPI00147D94BE|nr:sulfotransferase domain-containing protein [Ruegeria arenilitoris]